MVGKQGLVSFLSVPRAIAAGVACGAAALMCWAGFAIWPQIFVLPYFIALAATVLCGVYVLLATFRDAYRNPRRGVRIKPIRGFDIAAGLLLVVPAGLGLAPFLRAF